MHPTYLNKSLTDVQFAHVFVAPRRESTDVLPFVTLRHANLADEAGLRSDCVVLSLPAAVGEIERTCLTVVERPEEPLHLAIDVLLLTVHTTMEFGSFALT